MIPGIKKTVSTSTIKLAGSYLAIIMLMSISFSVVFYNASSQQLGRQLPPAAVFEDGPLGAGVRNQRPQVEAFLESRIAEGRQALLQRLLLLNLMALFIGALLSYYLARRTLEPIERNMEAQYQFVSDASHELRTPLTSMQTVNEVALRRQKMTTQEAREIIKQNIEEVVKLKTLTDGLLKLADPDRGKLPGKKFSLQDVSSESMNAVIEIAQKKNISIEDEVDNINVMGDLQSLAQAVVILLDNGIKYSPSGSKIHLSSEARGSFAYLHVRDEGPGIRPYDLRKIFDRFYRADQSRNKEIVSGHGIGLSIAKKILQQHGGDITVISTVGSGSTFTVKVPLA